ncbi:hypothetical protein P5V15_015576 [Pogonomyrmex californicus]
MNELHDHYMQFSTVDFTLLSSAADRCKSDMHHVIQSCTYEMIKEELDMNKLKLCKMILCYEYQTMHSSQITKKYVQISGNINDLHIPNIKMIFPSNCLRNSLQVSLLCDIIILQIVLYFDNNFSMQYVKNFLYLYETYFVNNDSKNMYMEVLGHLIEIFRLQPSPNPDICDLTPIYLEIMKSWMNTKKDSEWRTFASILPKLVDIFPSEYMVFPLWDYVLCNIDDLKESLTVLSIMADTCLLPSNSMNYIHRDIYCKNTFWLLILKGLRSSLQQYRKQALYVMKKAINSMSENIRSELIKLQYTKEEIIPFICIESDTFLVDNIKEKFYLLYEVLEEKQDHLVMPALTHMTVLVEANKEHKICNCFDIVWLQCIFEKILLHENNRIVKWGISYVCKLDETVFNDQFLKLFISMLNNTFLYECQTDEKYPGIVRELSEFFERAQKSDLLNKFLKRINEIVWGPVAIFYIIYALRIASSKQKQHCTWQTAELDAIKSLVQTNLSMHSYILRTTSQIELLQVIPNYVQQIDDLSLLANVLAAFFFRKSLNRNTVPWNIITAWLSRILSKKNAITFVEDTCMQYLHVEANPEVNLKTFAMLVCLLYDAKFIFSHKECPAAKALNNWLNTLNSITVRPYADIPSSINAVEFISHLIGHAMEKCNDNITKFVSLHIKNTFNFLIKNIRKMSTELTYEDYTRYTVIVSLHIYKASFFMSEKDAHSYVERLQKEGINLVNDLKHNLNMQYLYGLHVLHISQKILGNSWDNYMKDILHTSSMNIQQDTDMRNLRGKIASEYFLLLSKLISQYLVNNVYDSLETLGIPVSTLLSNLQQFLELGLPKNVPEIISILRMINYKFICEENNEYINNRKTFEYIFNLGFTCIMDSKKNNIFWTAMEELVGVIISNKFLRLPNAVEFVKGYIVKLLNEGENTPRFKRIILSEMQDLKVENMMKLEALLVNCLLHGSVYRRDKKIETNAHLFIIKHLSHYYPEHIFTIDNNNDIAIRAEAVILLHKIISHPEIKYVETFTRIVINALEQNKNRRYFKDSILHKLKHRLMQILLILEPILTAELTFLVYKKLCDFIYTESNQSSVKLMQEWLMIRILVKNNDLHKELWSLFEKSIESRPRCTISMASIVYHVSKLLSNDNQKIFIETALPYIVQCCLGQQFNARIYNQFVLTRLCELMKATYGDDSISAYKGIYQAAAIATLQQENSIKNSGRMQDDFYFSHFHPINDYSLQAIYYEFPRLTNVSCDEWISPDVFKDLMFKQRDRHPLQLYNTDSLLSKTKFSIYLTKSVTGDARGESCESNVEICLEGLYDIQKKIDPSKPPDLNDDVFGMMKEFIYTQNIQLQEGLIVVASFVDRPPNLGGIARTCEIFGVKALVVANVDCVKDKEFQSLSVSADKWLNMIQVKPHELQKFLLNKKNAGWSLIGAEQTTNSVNLMTTHFQKKTVLILGNEKDGIPANFIPLFDKCVEIPQVGVTRSLNVHVTAAICIWQYASQHILK